VWESINFPIQNGHAKANGKMYAYINLQLLGLKTEGDFFLSKHEYIKLASRLIKNLLVPLDTLVRKRVRLKLNAPIKVYIIQKFAKNKARWFIDPTTKNLELKHSIANS
jgi:hypothetical protein